MAYSKEEYDELNLDEYRERFPEVTKDLPNEKIYDVVMAEEDDLDDDDWIKKFKAAA